MKKKSAVNWCDTCNTILATEQVIGGKCGRCARKRKQECKRLILSGVIAPGDKLPSVRELAGSLSINPNTIQRAYRELEADGYLISVPGKGSFAAEARPLQEQKKQELFSKIRSLSQQAMALGATREELLAQIPTKEEEA